MKLKNISALLVFFIIVTLTISAVSAEDVNDNSSSSNLDSLGSSDLGFSSSNLDSVLDMDESENQGKSADLEGTNDKGNLQSSSNIIYVSQDGDDNNDGLTRETAVATLNRSVELAGDNTIIYVANGVYETSRLLLNKDISLSFVGEEKGQVVFKAEINESTHTSGGIFNVLDKGINLLLKNITFTGVNSSTTNQGSVLKIQGNGTLDIEDCIFIDNIVRYGVISTSTSNNVTIRNCIFEDNGIYQANSYGIITVSNGNVTFENVLINNSRIRSTSNSTYMNSLISLSKGSLNFINTSISNSNGRINNLIYTKGNLTLKDSKIYNNTINSSGNYYLITLDDAKANVSLDKVLIVNNSLLNSLINITKGNLSIRYSGIYNNDLNGSLVLAASEYVTDYNADIDYNWWGTSNNVKSLISQNVEINNWICLNASANQSDQLEYGDTVELRADFNVFMDAVTGEVFALDEDKHLVDGVEVIFANEHFNMSASTEDGIAFCEYQSNGSTNEIINLYTPDMESSICLNYEEVVDYSVIYVSTNGDDINGDGTEKNPYNTIEYALGRVTDERNTIYIKKGEYFEYDLIISNNVTIIGEDRDEVVIDAESRGRIFIINGDASLVNITSLSLINARAESGGDAYGLINAGGDAYGLANASIDDYQGKGGAILLKGGSLVLEDVYVFNSTSLAGGAIAIDLDEPLANPTLASLIGAADALLNVNSSMDIDLSELNGYLLIRNSLFKENSYDYDASGDGSYETIGGGAIYSNSLLIIDNSSFVENSGVSYGEGSAGALYIGSNAIIINSNFTRNSAIDAAGAIFINSSNGEVLLKNNYFYQNGANKGGAIFSNNTGLAVILDNTLVKNSAMDGGAIFSENSFNIIQNNQIINNTAMNGGGIELKLTKVLLINNTMDNNASLGKGDNILSSESYINANLTFLNNSSLECIDGDSVNLSIKASDDRGTVIVGLNISCTLNNQSVGDVLTDNNGTATLLYQSNVTDTCTYIVSGIPDKDFADVLEEMKNNLSDFTDFLDLYARNVLKTGLLTVYSSNSFHSLSRVIQKALQTGVLNLSHDFVKESSEFSRYRNGISLPSRSLIINGNGFAIDANNSGFIFKLNRANLTLYNLTLKNADSDTYGACISSVNSTVILDNCTLINNKALGSASIDASSDSRIYVNNSYFANNTASLKDGGAISGVESLVYIENSVFENNSALENGGAIKILNDGNLTVVNSRFINNTANGSASLSYGGAVYNWMSSLNISNSRFINNSAATYGGAVYISYSSFNNITQSHFEDNRAKDGGAIYSELAYLDAHYNSFINNRDDSNLTAVSVYTIVDFDYNWWGSNDDPLDLVSSEIYLDKWVVMSVAYNETAYLDGNYNISAEFTHSLNRENLLTDLEMNIPEQNVFFQIEKGNLTALDLINCEDGSSVISAGGMGWMPTNDNKAVVSYCPVEGPYDRISINSANETFIITINLLKNPSNISLYSWDNSLNHSNIIVFLNGSNGPIANENIRISVYDEAFENISNLENLTNDEGLASFDLSLLAAGNYNIDIVFEGSGAYENSSARYSFEILNKKTLLSCKLDDLIIGEDYEIMISLINADSIGLNASVIANIGDVEYNVTVTGGSGILDFRAEEIALMNVEILFAGDGSYDPASFSGAFTVYGLGNRTVKHTGDDSRDIQEAVDAANPGDTIQLGNYNYANVSDINLTKSIIIKANEESSITGDKEKVFVIVSNEEDAPEMIEFSGLNCIFLKEGSSFLVAQCSEHDNLNHVPAIDIHNCSFSLGDSVSSNGIAILTVSSNSSGFYPTSPISVTNNTLISGMSPFVFLGNIYDGGDVLIPKASPIATVMTLEAIYTSSSGDYNAAVALKDIYGKAIGNAVINYSISGRDYQDTTDDEGKLTVCNLKSGDDLFVYYLDEDYLSSNLTVGIAPDKKDSTMIQCANMTTNCIVESRSGDYFIARLTDSKGNPLSAKKVQIGFNGKIYERTTNESGEFRLQVNLVSAGGYTFAISFLGDDDYNASFAVAKINVVKNNPVLSIPTTRIKAASSIKYDLSISMKTAKGKIISGRTVSLTIDGKTYTAKTDYNGIAKVKVSLTTKKTYAYTLKFAGDSTCNAKTQTGKITLY